MVERYRWAYSKPAADGSFSSATTSKPAVDEGVQRQEALRARGVGGHADRRLDALVRCEVGVRAVVKVALQLGKEARRAGRPAGRQRPARSTSVRGPASLSRRLNDRRTDQPGSWRTAAASKPKRSSPAVFAATIEGHVSSPSNDTTGSCPVDDRHDGVRGAEVDADPHPPEFRRCTAFDR